MRVATFKAPCVYFIGVAEIAIAICKVVVPHRSCKEFSTCSSGILPFFVEIGTALETVGIKTQFGVDEVIDKRRHVNIFGIASLWVGKVIGLNGLLCFVNILLDIGQLLLLQILLLGIDARPRDLAGHDALTNARHFRGESGVVLIVGVDADDVASRQFRSLCVCLSEFGNFHAPFTPFDSL